MIMIDTRCQLEIPNAKWTLFVALMLRSKVAHRVSGRKHIHCGPTLVILDPGLGLENRLCASCTATDEARAISQQLLDYFMEYSRLH